MKTVGFAIGMIISIMIGIVLAMIAFRNLNTDNSMKTKYDERQQIVRGQGYKYSFWTVICLIVLTCILDACEISLPMKNTVLYFLIIAIGVMVHTTYCVFHDGYFGINNKPRQYYMAFVFIGLFNVFIGIVNSLQGRLVENGKLDVPSINFFCGAMFVILGISIVIKKYFIKDDEDMDEEDEEE